MKVLLGTFGGGDKTCLEFQETFLRTAVTFTEEEVSGSSEGDDVVTVTHKAASHSKKLELPLS